MKCVNSGSPTERSRHDQPLPRAGFSLIEAIFYLAIVLLISAPIISSTLVGTSAVAETDVVMRLQERSRSSLVRLVGDVRRAIGETLQVSDASLAFTLAEEFDGVAVIPGNRIVYGFEAEPADPANNLDDNGNGIVDEGRLVRTNQDTGESIVLCSGVDLQASRFAPIAGGVDVTLSSAGSTRREDDIRQITRSVAVFSRN